MGGLRPATGTADGTAVPGTPSRPGHYVDEGYSTALFAHPGLLGLVAA